MHSLWGASTQVGPAATAGLCCLPLTQGGLVPFPPKDAGLKPRVGPLAPLRATSLASCLFSGRDPAQLAAPPSRRRLAGHPGLLFICSCCLWCCGGMSWLLGIVLGHPLVGLPCPLLIFAAASQELRNRPAASSRAGLPGNECRGENLYRCLAGKYSGIRQARCILSCSPVLHMLSRVVVCKSRLPQPRTPFPWVLAAGKSDRFISGRQTTTDPDQQQRCLSCYSNEMGCRCHSWAGNGYLGVQPASQEVQKSLGVAWMGAITSPSSTSQAAGQQGWVLPASEYGELFP